MAAVGEIGRYIEIAGRSARVHHTVSRDVESLDQAIVASGTDLRLAGAASSGKDDCADSV